MNNVLIVHIMSETMTVASLKIQDYKLLTLFLNSTSVEALEEALASKSSDSSMAKWTQSQPIVLNYAQASDYQSLNLEKLVETAAKMDFCVVGITAGDNKELNKILMDMNTHPFTENTYKNKTENSATNSPKDAAVAENGNEQVKTCEIETTAEELIEEANLPNLDKSTTLIHVGTVRSGTQIYAKNKSLVIIGNVGNGADVMADDCVYIFGAARGRIMAGGSSNTESLVYCTDFNPQLISIGGIYKTSDDIDEKLANKHVLANLNANSFEFKVLE
jgi:septum site-determining protein MinC